MVIFHAGVKENPHVDSNIISSCEEDAQASVGSQKEDIDPQFKISTWFKTPLFYQVVICDKVFKNRPYRFQIFKGYFPQILVGRLLNILTFVFTKPCLLPTLEIFLCHRWIYIHDFQVNFFLEIYRLVYNTDNAIDNILTHLFFQSLVCHQLLKSFYATDSFICMVFESSFFLRFTA